MRLVGPPAAAVTARLRLHRPLRAAWWSELDERTGAAIDLGATPDTLAFPIAADEVVTVKLA